MGLISGVWNLLPDNYKWDVAARKIGLTFTKTILAVIAGTKLGKEISPEHLAMAQTLSSAAIAAGLKWVHDWAKVKYPDVDWL